MLSKKKKSCRFISLLIALFGKNQSLLLPMCQTKKIGSSIKLGKNEEVKLWL